MRTTLRWTTAALLAAVALPAAVAVAALDDTPVRATPNDERLPSADGDAGYLVWAQNARSHRRHYDTFVSLNGGPKVQVNEPGTIGWAGRIDGNVLAYQQVRGTQSNIRFFDLTTHERSTPTGVNTQAWEFRPSISGEWILYGRQTRTRNEIVLHNLVTGETRKLAQVPRDRVALPGQVNGDYVAFMKCGRVTCNVFRYQITTGETTTAPNLNQRVQYAPSVSADGTVYYASSKPACGLDVQIRKAPVGAATATILTIFPAHRDVDSTYADDRADGSTDVYHDRGPCGGTWPNQNLFKLVDPA